MKSFFQYFKNRLENGDSVENQTKRLLDFVLKSGFRVFKDRTFRQQFHFSDLKEKEELRLFNELEVTAICLLLLVLEGAEEWARKDKRFFWQEVYQKITKDLLNQLKRLKLSSPYRFLVWEKLVDARHQEYKESLPHVYRASGVADPKFIKSGNERRKAGYVRFMAVAIGAIYHLRKGKTDVKDSFFKELRTWLEILNAQLEGKIYH